MDALLRQYGQVACPAEEGKVETVADDAQQRIEAYLNKLRGKLRGMNEAEIREIVTELRGHIVERATSGGAVTAAGVEAALAALGSPDALATDYMTCEVLARAQTSRWPWRVLENLFRWATLSFVGIWVLLCAVVGYLLGFAFLLCAVLKPLHPHTAGLWVYSTGGGVTYSLRLGFSSPPPAGHEVLGWWMVPVGVVVGGALILLTTWFALLCARAYRRSPVLRTKEFS